MRRSWSASVLLAGGLVLLVSLYLPWRKSTCPVPPTGSRSVGSTLDAMLASCQSADAWSSGVGPEAALAALALVTTAIVILARPMLRRRAPLVLCGLAAGYFAFAADAGVRRYADRLEVAGVRYHMSYGAYVGLTAA